MVMLSELLRYQVSGAKGEHSKLIDLVISQLDSDYPLVTHIIDRLPNQRDERLLPWKAVKGIDHAARQINVEHHGQAKATDTLRQVVRLRLDVLDALILDLQNRRTTRANDLWLEQDEGLQLHLAA